jgi:hypothetical protein
VNTLLNKILLNSKNKVLSRLIAYSVFLICIIIIGHIFISVPVTEKQKFVFSEYYNIQDSIKSISLNTSDSILAHSRIMIDKGVMIDWDDAALWLENIRSYAFISGVEITYEIDSLRSFPEGGTNFFIISVRFEAISVDGKFETIMQFVEDVSNDTTVTTRLDNIEFNADVAGLQKTYFQLTGWIRL